MFMLAVWAALASSFAQAAPAFRLGGNGTLNDISAHEYLEVWNDESKTTSIETLLKIDPHFEDYNFEKLKGAGFSNSIYWLRFKVMNTDKAAQTIYLKATDPQQYLDFYSLDADGKTVADSQKLGSFRPISLQRLTYRFPVMEINTKPGLNTYVLRMNILSVTFPYRFWTKNELLEKSRSDQVVLAFLFGSFFIMALYNVLLGITTHSVEYFLYCGYLTLFIVLQLFLTGAGRLYFNESWALL